MPLSRDVTLPKATTAVFPDRCILCAAPRPGSTVRVGSQAIGWWTWLFWTSGKGFRVEVPACAGCGRRMTWARRMETIVVFVLAVGLIVALGPVVRTRLSGTAMRWALFGLVLLCIIPLAVVRVLRPPPFDITVYADRVDYEFRDHGLAFEFALLNDAIEGLEDPTEAEREAEARMRRDLAQRLTRRDDEPA